MPIDPSIIGNVMVPSAPQLPDVNAMLETQTRGAENIYKIETARQQQALAAQKEQEAAQEAATIKALLPAYTYGIQTGDVTGISGLVPPEMLETVQPYIDALAGRPPEEVKAALIGSLSSSQAGQEALAAIQRAQTAQIQLGQLDVSRERLAFDTEQAGKPPEMTPFQEAQIALDREKFAAEQAAKAAIASGEAPPVSLQKGERWNPETQRVEAAPGSATYNKQKSTQSKDYAAATNALRELDKVRGVVSDLKNTTGYQKAMNTGTIMANAPNIPGVASYSGAYDFQTKYKNLKGSVATLGRAAASLHGKLGNMAVQEWKMVSDSIANLDLSSMDADVLDGQLAIIANDIAALEAQVRDAYEKEWGDTQFYAPLGGRGPAGAGEEPNDDPLGIRGRR